MSHKQFFISDPHFGHLNMAKKRGFPDAYHHDSNIVAQWNAVVSKKDTVWILGDITMEKGNYEILNKLLGIKRVILGNHDPGNKVSELLKYVNSVHSLVKFKDKKHGNFWLSHCPVHPCELEYRVSRNIHGHVHENTLNDERYINVCMEVQDYTPKTIDQLCQKD